MEANRLMPKTKTPKETQETAPSWDERFAAFVKARQDKN